MNKIAMVCLAAAMTLGSGAAMAAGGNNGTSNQAADAGARSARRKRESATEQR